MGWSNDQATTLNGQAFTYLNSTTTYDTGSALAIDTDATFTINGRSPGLGVVAFNRGTTDLPHAGTTAATAGTAATVLTTTLATARQGRIYQISAPGLAVRMNVAARTGVQLDITEDGSAPTPGSGNNLSQFVNCPTVGSPVPCPISTLYVRAVADGTLRVLLSIWNVSGGGATVANGSLGPNFNPVELIITDMGTNPGATS